MPNLGELGLKVGPSRFGPQGKAHVKAKVLLPWPTELHFKTAFLNVCGLFRDNLNMPYPRLVET